VAVPNLPRREVGRAGVYWLALGPSARTSGGRLGTAMLLPLLVAEGVLSHTLTFECVGQCSCKVLNRHRQAAVVLCTGGNCQWRRHYVRVRHQGRTFSSHVSLLRALATRPHWPSRGARRPGAAPGSRSWPCRVRIPCSLVRCSA